MVRLTVWGIRPHGIPAALGRMAVDRWALRAAPGLRFGKLLGTGSGHSFGIKDADPLHWALLTVWDDDAAADRFAAGRVHRGWDRLAQERLDVRMSPLSNRGRWARREPFGGNAFGDSAIGDEQAVAVITRARLRPARAASFWRAVPPVAAELHTAEGLALAIGIGEAPVGVQGTFSIWRSTDALTAFAYRRPAHLDVVRRTVQERWYAEELFARFAVHSVEGTLAGRDPLAGQPALE
jgi:hypothetical protein